MNKKLPDTGITRTTRPDLFLPAAGKGLRERSRLRQCDRPSVRSMLKAFIAESAPPNTLFWDDRLDTENGSGIRIALLDSGLNGAQSVFDGARVQGRDFTGNHDLFDPTGHGTANAALLAGRGTGEAYGLSYASDLLVAKVLGSAYWQATARAIATAIRWAVDNAADVIVLPFGSGRRVPMIHHEIGRAVAKGCQIFAAAGNHGPEYIGFPAWLPEVTAVSALTADGRVLPICCAREEVDVYIWGDAVPVFGVSGATELSGSSPAAVLAAGFAALRLAASRNERATG